MNSLIALKRGLSAEIYKFRGTFAFWLLIIAPAFIPVINLIIFTQRGEDIVTDGNAWDMLMRLSMGPANFLFPFFIIMIALLVNNIEYNANTWKLIYTQPLSRWTVYLAKVKNFLGMLFIALMLFSVFTYLVGLSMRSLKPGLGFEESFDIMMLFSLFFKVFLTTLGMAAIQYWISQRWKNLILPLGVGIAGVISFLIVAQGWKYAKYHPYGYHTFASGNIDPENPQIWADMEHVYLSLGVALVVFFLAGLEQSRKRIV